MGAPPKEACGSHSWFLVGFLSSYINTIGLCQAFSSTLLPNIRPQTHRGVQAPTKERTYSRMGCNDLISHALAFPSGNAIPSPKQTHCCFPAFCNFVCLPLNGTSPPVTLSAPGASLFVPPPAHSSPIFLKV